MQGEFSLATQRKYRSYRSLIACTPLSAVDRLASLINGIQAGDALAIWRDPPDLSAYPDVRFAGLTEWTTETLLRDVLAYGGMYGTRDLLVWSQFAEVANKLNDLENDIWSEVRDEDLIWYELFRIGHRQFDWQTGITRRDIGRYLGIYDFPPLRELILNQYGLHPHEIVKLWFQLANAFRTQKLIRTPIDFSHLGIDNLAANNFIGLLTTNLSIASKEARRSSLLDLDFAYRPSPFRSKPIVRLVPNEHDTHIYCPVQRFLFDRMTDGLYYDLVKRKDFANPYGFGFQAYDEKTCRSMLPERYSVLGEAKYGSTALKIDSLDVIVSDESADLFVECKSRRASLSAKTTLTSGTTTLLEMDKIVDGIVQSYKRVDDALRGRFSHWKSRSLPTYLLIVFVKPWYINSPRLGEYLHKATATRLASVGISPSVMHEAPLTLCSSEELEVLSSVLRETTIDRLFAQKVDPEFSGWQLGSFLHSQFKDVAARQRSMLVETLSEPLRRAFPSDATLEE